MADFFDTEKQADIDLLHKDVRTHDELQNVVDKVEWEILDFYSQREGLGITVYEDFWLYEDGNDPSNEILVRLVGYDQTTPTDSDADLQEQLRRTIADVVSWVLRNYDNEDNVSSISQGKRSISFSGNVPTWRKWPSGWRQRLKNYDARIAKYGL